MEILFIGGLFPKETENEILQHSTGNIDNAANNLQWELVKGLEDNINSPITIINSLYIGSYPKRYSQWKIETYDFSKNLKYSKGKNVGFNNVTGIKRATRYSSLKPFVKEWILANRDSERVIIAYAMTSTFTKLLEYSKTIDGSVTTCLIVPDLPQYMNLSGKQSILHSFLEKFELNTLNKNMEFIDSFVVLTEPMIEALQIKKPYVVIEGIANSLMLNTSAEDNMQLSNEKTIVYTGALYKKFGIIELIEAFKKIPQSNYKLIICGSGDAEDYVLRACQENSRIIFKGLLKRDDVLEIQKQATILVNPRNNNDEYTKYSFPSKIMEYMSSGRPVVAYSLDGMPEEYNEYLFIISNNHDSMYNTLKEVTGKSEEKLNVMGKKAQKFVLNEKNNIKQCGKIIKMLENII